MGKSGCCRSRKTRKLMKTEEKRQQSKDHCKGEILQVLVVGGFLGGGKTTTIINMEKYLAEKGKKLPSL